MTRMAPGSKRGAAPSSKRSALAWIAPTLILLVAVAAFCFYEEHTTSDSPAETQVAALQPEVTGTQSLARSHLYSPTANPTQDISEALDRARRENKRVIVDFGGDWCGDCQVLEYYMHQPANVGLLNSNFVVVHVYAGENGQLNRNLDLASKYDVPIFKGVPALAVLDAQGKLLYSQRDREFEKMSTMDPASVNEFLNRWKA